MADKGFDELLRDVEDNIFGLDDDSEESPPENEDKKEEKPVKEKRKRALPVLIDNTTANDIFKDFMKKEKNQRKYEMMGSELKFKPYWFFTYTAELIMRDENGNIVDSEEIGGRVAVDAETGALADYLQDLLDHEPIQISDLADEVAQTGGEAKVEEAKIGETRLEHFIIQKIAGALRAEKENVSVAGFELMWAPVYRFWLTIKKKTHNVQIDGTGGYPINYDDMQARPKTWSDILEDDIELLKDPKKWRKFLDKKMKGAQKGASKPSNNTMELIGGVVGVLLFLYGLSARDLPMMAVGAGIVVFLFWHMNAQRKKPLVPLPPPPYAQAPPPPQ
jgi:hypothetical protein